MVCCCRHSHRPRLTISLPPPHLLEADALARLSHKHAEHAGCALGCVRGVCRGHKLMRDLRSVCGACSGSDALQVDESRGLTPLALALLHKYRPDYTHSIGSSGAE